MINNRLFIGFMMVACLLLVLVGCDSASKKVEPNASMFDLQVHLPDYMEANKPVEVKVDLINKSMYDWDGNHGLDIYSFVVTNAAGEDIPTYEGMQLVDGIGIALHIDGHGVYSYYKKRFYQDSLSLNQITIKQPGAYTLQVTGKFQIEINNKYYEIMKNSKSIPIQIR